ncbi:MAG: dihydrodipicolinate synthase family protein [Angelakisella sp.]
MRNLKKYHGVFPAFYACYADDGSVSAERTEAFTRYLSDKGVKGLYVCGSSGECIYQSVAERKLTLECVMKARGNMTVIAHVACNNTADSVELARHAQSLGVDAIAAIPPIYFKLPDYSMADYWNAISAGAPNTDFFIYNIPQLAGIALSKGLFSTMLQNPMVVGVKNSSPAVQDIQLFKAMGGKDCIVFNGPDEQFVGGRIMGADGGIGGTYASMPELFLRADELVKNGQFEKATELQFAINEIIYAFLECKGNMYAVIKEILRRRDKMDIGGVRAPLSNIFPEDLPKIEHTIKLIDTAIHNFVG